MSDHTIIITDYSNLKKMLNRTQPTGKLIIISGPSGAGKTTLIDQVLESIPNITCAKSATTRPQRHTETDADYYFLSDEQFDQKIKSDAFVEWCNVHQNRYGTLKEEVVNHLQNGKHILLEIDVQGTRKVQDKFPEVIKIFIAPPSIDALRQRLIDRKTDSQDVIEARLNVAKKELESIDEYDYIIENVNLDESNQLLNRYLTSKLSV